MIRALILNDIRYMRKDPMCIVAFIMPIILACLYNFLLLKVDFISEYLGVARYMFILIIPMMVGMMFGFRFLDEKDERVLSVYAVSPLGMRKYIVYRIIQCIIVALIEIIIIYLVGIKADYNVLTSIIMATLLGPFIFLILGILGKNKIQGGMYIIGMILLMGLMVAHFYKKSIINI